MDGCLENPELCVRVCDTYIQHLGDHDLGYCNLYIFKIQRTEKMSKSIK